ncbi:hypothetical protein GMOD_00003908 [Pyrenophora seminiperda CCB06]|uniref:Uncharacterized protein n=1 Tax=Pyrenophora seminiperda CCB06 TaxID=1302712 RepID=A0A3M7M0D6_9PLEO|nr:hypothetical protein GMOD_00003908 [Pyrenophora seminiperda CCB06]
MLRWNDGDDALVSAIGARAQAWGTVRDHLIRFSSSSHSAHFIRASAALHHHNLYHVPCTNACLHNPRHAVQSHTCSSGPLLRQILPVGLRNGQQLRNFQRYRSFATEAGTRLSEQFPHHIDIFVCRRVLSSGR